MLESSGMKLVPAACFALVLSVAAVFSAESPLDQGLAVYLPFTGDLRDHSGRDVPIRVHGAVALTGEGGFFPGGHGDYLELPHIALNERTFSVAMWVKVAAKEPMWGLLTQRASGDPDHWLHLMFRGGLQPYLGFYINDAISPSPVQVAEWVHLVFQYSGTRQEIWINGNPVCARESGPYKGTAGETFIGRSPDWYNVPSRNFHGLMRELRIYTRALSHNEINLLTGREGEFSASSLPDPELSKALAADVGIPFLNITPGKLFITGEANQVYELFATADLNQPFEPVATLTNTHGRVEFTDHSGAMENKFYTLRTRHR